MRKEEDERRSSFMGLTPTYYEPPIVPHSDDSPGQDSHPDLAPPLVPLDYWPSALQRYVPIDRTRPQPEEVASAIRRPPTLLELASHRVAYCNVHGTAVASLASTLSSWIIVLAVRVNSRILDHGFHSIPSGLGGNHRPPWQCYKIWRIW